MDAADTVQRRLLSHAASNFFEHLVTYGAEGAALLIHDHFHQ